MSTWLCNCMRQQVKIKSKHTSDCRSYHDYITSHKVVIANRLLQQLDVFSWNSFMSKHFITGRRGLAVARQRTSLCTHSHHKHTLPNALCSSTDVITLAWCYPTSIWQMPRITHIFTTRHLIAAVSWLSAKSLHTLCDSARNLFILSWRKQNSPRKQNASYRMHALVERV